jgi:hypothetical protein
MISAAGIAYNTTLGLGDSLAQQVGEQTEELRRKRMMEAKQAGFSPAGQALSIDFGMMSVPGAQ